MSKIHIWTGITPLSEAEFWKYFDQSKGFQFDEQGNARSESERQLSGFSTDLGQKNTYEDDFLGCYYSGESDDLEAALDDLPDPDIIDDVRDACMERGIEAANAMITYTDAELVVPESAYELIGLRYIGCYDWS